jgi:hypothetical protein
MISTPRGKFHSIDCAVEAGKRKAPEVAEKLQKKRDRERKAKLDDTVPNWIKKAQAAFNSYIRERDRGKPCISCGRSMNDGGYIGASGYNAGHYRSVGANPELRFEESNCHGQCAKPCNIDLGGNVVNYRIGLIDRIGPEKLEWLEGPHPKKQYRVEELKEIAKHYNRLARELKRQRND